MCLLLQEALLPTQALGVGAPLARAPFYSGECPRTVTVEPVCAALSCSGTRVRPFVHSPRCSCLHFKVEEPGFELSESATEHLLTLAFLLISVTGPRLIYCCIPGPEPLRDSSSSF